MHSPSKLWNRILMIILTEVLAVSLLMLPCNATAYADEVEGVSELAEENEEISGQIEQQQAEIESLKENSIQLEEEIEAIDEELNTVATAVKFYNEKAAGISEDIVELQEKIQTINDEIASTEKDIDARYKLMKERIAFFYENGDTTVLEALFSMESFSKILKKIVNFQALVEYDREQSAELNDIVKSNNEKKAELESQVQKLAEEQEELAQVQKESEEQQAYYEELVTYKAQQLQDTNAQIELKQESVTELEAQIESNKSEMTALVAQYDEMIRQAEEQRKAEEESRRQAEKESKKAERESKKAERESRKAEEESRRAEAESNGEEYIPEETYDDEEEESDEDEEEYDDYDSDFDYDSVTFAWPLPEEYTTITSYFGYRGDDEDLTLFGGVTDMHTGIDIYAPVGTEIYAVLDGIVVVSDYSSAIGWYMAIYHGNGIYTEAHHMSSQCPVAVGTSVSQGDVVGYVGATGYYCTGPHIHFGVCIGQGEWLSVMNYVDPAPFLGID